MSTHSPPTTGSAKRTTQDLIVTAFGLVTSSLTALILALVESKLDFALYSLTFWFVIPIGALLSGFVGAGGYYFGAKLFHHRPTRLLLFNVMSVAVSTYVLVNWLNYSFLQIEGRYISDVIPFSQYMDIALSHQTMEFRIRGAKLGETGELGSFGYFTALLQILGFAVGGLCIYFHLQTAPYCEACGKYLKKLSTTSRYTSLSDQIGEVYPSLISHLKDGNSGGAWEVVSGVGVQTRNGQDFKLELSLWKCKTCPKEFAEFSVYRWDVKEWKALAEFHVRDYVQTSGPALP